LILISHYTTFYTNVATGYSVYAYVYIYFYVYVYIDAHAYQYSKT